MNKSKPAFTLIELLVVVSIIGLLSSVVLAQLAAARVKGQISQTVQTMVQIRNAAALYRTDNGSYPSSVDALIPKYIPSKTKNPLDSFGFGYLITPENPNPGGYYCGESTDYSNISNTGSMVLIITSGANDLSNVLSSYYTISYAGVAAISNSSIYCLEL